ncbi:hypothetical protein V6U90_11020 [Micromonospora sp. CPCC 206060]|uniref:hypothetical protein n=1 Tax=Micromonospora sp. CPCC 206060 TaxID=3122406 RepID=UPI002FF3A91E
MTARRAGSLGLAALLLVGAGAACGRSEPEPDAAGPSTDPAPTSAPTTTGPVGPGDVTYTLPAKLCPAVDDAALAEIFPRDGGAPVLDIPGACGITRLAEGMTVGLNVDAELLKDGQWAQRFYETGRRLARGTPTDIDGAGTAAFWTVEKNRIKLVTYHGNLALTLTCEPVAAAGRLPADVPQRLARVAAGTFARLAP